MGVVQRLAGDNPTRHEAARRGYDSTMAMRVVRYSVGNENNPSDPWGRSELMIGADGVARLDHFYSRRVPSTGAWTGRVAPAALDALWAGLEQAGFPVPPSQTFMPGSTIRQLTVEVDGVPQSTMVDYHKSSKFPGYAEAFDVLDGVIRQLSGDTVPHPTKQPPIVSDVTDVAEQAV
jgi:hypothetical protein